MTAWGNKSGAGQNSSGSLGFPRFKPLSLPWCRKERAGKCPSSPSAPSRPLSCFRVLCAELALHVLFQKTPQEELALLFSKAVVRH